MAARDLINGSFRLIGVLAEGEVANASQAQDALAALNSMLDSWSTESLSVMGVVQHIVTLAQSQQMYTMGPSGDIDVPRPTKVQDVSAVFPSSPYQVFLPVDELNVDQYSSIPVIGYQTPIPCSFYVNYSYPLNEFYMYPMPQAGTQLRFFSQETILSVPSLNTDMVFAPGYEKAIRYALALELAPEYSVTPSPVVIEQAAIAKGNIERLNAQDLVLGLELPVFGRTGYFNRITG